MWAVGDRVIPPSHGRRLAELLPQGHLVEIADSYTLVPLDQPSQLAAAIREFAALTLPAQSAWRAGLSGTITQRGPAFLGRVAVRSACDRSS